MNDNCRTRAWFMSILVSLAVAVPAALADPPPQAPAHGWRKKHDPYYVGYTGRHWQDDYGIRGGRCDRSRVATVLGTVAGGVIGAKVADEDDRLIAILVGAAIGAVVGSEIDEELDRDDRGCFGHALELQGDGHRVRWDGARAGLRYELTPGGRFERNGNVCRHFTLVRELDRKRVKKRGSACRHGEGEWRMFAD